MMRAAAAALDSDCLITRAQGMVKHQNSSRIEIRDDQSGRGGQQRSGKEQGDPAGEEIPSKVIVRGYTIRSTVLGERDWHWPSFEQAFGVINSIVLAVILSIRYHPSTASSPRRDESIWSRTHGENSSILYRCQAESDALWRRLNWQEIQYYCLFIFNQ